MDDTKKTVDQKPGESSGRTLSLNRPTGETSRVRQSFPHGRVKTVVVETKRRRIIQPGKPKSPVEITSALPEEVLESPALLIEDHAQDTHAVEEGVSSPEKGEASDAQGVIQPPVAESEKLEVLEHINEDVPPKNEVQNPAPLAQESLPKPVIEQETRTGHSFGVKEKDRSSRGQSRYPGGHNTRASRSTGEQSSRSSAKQASGGRVLTQGEKDARERALVLARQREVEEKKRAEELEKLRLQRLEEEARLAEERLKQELEEEKKREKDRANSPLTPEGFAEDRKSPTKHGSEGTVEKKINVGRTAQPGAFAEMLAKEESEEARNKGRKDTKALVLPKPTRTTDQDRRRGRLTVSNALEEDDERRRSLSAFRRRTERQRKQAQGLLPAKEKIAREVVIPEFVTIQDLANRMAERSVDVIKLLMKQGQMHKINDLIDADTAQLVAEELGHTVKRVAESDVEEGIMGEEDALISLTSRAPVVTVMGHVDHGKTSLLDALREANVVSGESGGITQHIGAYRVETPSGVITFIDTPGHEAFTAMRARGAKATDIVVLVVAADDGVMPQTIEAINHARAAQVPIIVAINKIDKPTANPLRVRSELLSHDVVVESMGGAVLEVEISALKRLNLEKLLEGILLQAEILDLKANSDRPADGIVIEAQLDKGRGPVATILVQRGTLRVGDIVVAGAAWGKVRALLDEHGALVKSAGPSVPVEILGFGNAPEAGDHLVVVDSEARARDIAAYRERKRRETRGLAGRKASLEQMMFQMKETGFKEFPILVKADVQGSGEAIVQALQKLSTEEVAARVVHYGVGGITESDLQLAAASGAVVLGFNVRANAQARDFAERSQIEIRYYTIIYDLVDDVKAAMSGLLAPTLRETFLGNAAILEVFNITKIGKVAGCRVTEGSVQRGAKVRLIRDNVVIYEGKLSTLKRFKDEAKEVLVGQECGMAFEGYQDIRQGDVIECFKVEEIKRSL